VISNRNMFDALTAKGNHVRFVFARELAIVTTTRAIRSCRKAWPGCGPGIRRPI